MSEKLEIEVVDAKGKGVSKKTLGSSFATSANPGLLHEVVRWQRAKRRAGTHAVKTRAEVSGGGVKPWRQKGTGRARAGSNRSPLWVHGGIAHGPKPRSYEFDLNKKEKKLALAAAISARVSEGKFLVTSGLNLSAIKTKDALSTLEKIGVPKGESAVIVLPKEDTIAIKSFRNAAGVKLLDPAGVNVYDVLNANYLVVVEQSLDVLEKRLS